MSSIIRSRDKGPMELATAKAGKELLDIDAAEFATSFERAPFLIGHDLCRHPLFRIERLLQLSSALPPSCVEYNGGEMPIGCDPAQTPRNGLSAEETIRRIESCKSWLVLKNVEQDQSYRALLDDCLAEVAEHSEPLHPGMCAEGAFIFLTSPGSITPYHMDPEHNFLLQIQGSKTITLFPRELVSAIERESFYQGAHRNLRFNDDWIAKGRAFDLAAGQAIHVPSTMPHFVRNGAGVSISFSITFRTPGLYRTARVHHLNRMLRQTGLHPADPGKRPSIDAAKSFTWRVVERSQRLLGRAS